MSIEAITERIRTLRDTLLTGLVERDEAVRLALLASLAGEHLLLVGPPGTAKSMVARRLHLAFAGATYFERLLTRFTVPEELFGPLSIKGLEEDRYERLTTSYLPQASVAFLDEIFKANSAILNALLTLLNEREFDNGAQRVKTPLIAVIGASNELPEGQELDALYDRFLLRLHVTPVSSDAFQALLSIRDTGPLSIPTEMRLSEQDRIFIGTYANTLAVPEDVIALLSSLREWCIAEEMDVSDRRWRKILKLLRVSAASNGRKEVSIWDCWLLQHCIWNSPEEREKVYEWYSARVGASAALDTSRITKIVVTWEARLKADQESKSQMRDEEGNPLYYDDDGALTTDEKGATRACRNNEPLFLAPSTAYESHREALIRDRTNEGTGYTEDELDRLITRRDHYNKEYFRNWSQRDAYVEDPVNWLFEEGFRIPYLEPTRHKQIYIEACEKELSEILRSIESYQEGVAQHLQSLERDIKSHLWVTGDFAAVASTSLRHTQADVETLFGRCEKVRAGFALLPLEEHS